jgi:hypothetical protein
MQKHKFFAHFVIIFLFIYVVTEVDYVVFFTTLLFNSPHCQAQLATIIDCLELDFDRLAVF